MGTTPTLEITRALDALLSALRAEHPEIPEIVLVVGATGRSKKGQVHGHFARETWEHETAKHEIAIMGESLARGAEATFGTLIHECAHAIAHVRDVQDTSNNHRYHNAKFKAIAEPLGITLDQAPTIGWSVTTLNSETAEKYSEGIEDLRAALVAYRKAAEPDEKDPKPRKKNTLKIRCQCDEGTTVNKKWWEKHGESLTCGDCFDHFEAVEEEEK